MTSGIKYVDRNEKRIYDKIFQKKNSSLVDRFRSKKEVRKYDLTKVRSGASNRREERWGPMDLGPEFIAGLKSQLLQEKAQLESFLQIRNNRGLGDRQGWAMDDDSAQAAAQQFLTDAEVTQFRGQLDVVNTLLDRVEKGTYGVCEACGQPIDLARLKVLPRTCCCVVCQRKRDATTKGRPLSYPGQR